MMRQLQGVRVRPASVWWRLGFVAVVAAGCAAKGTAGIAASAAGAVTVPARREFVITRDANPSTGYQWRLGGPVDERIVTLLHAEYQPAREPRPGAPGAQVWTFKAVGAGTTTLVFEYVRPWETGVAPARRDEVTVTVTVEGR